MLKMAEKRERDEMESQKGEVREERQNVLTNCMMNIDSQSQ